MKQKTWTELLFALIFIALPALVGFLFLLPDFSNRQIVPYWGILLIALGFVLYAIGFTSALIKLGLISLQALNFNLPITIILALILITYPLNIWFRVILIFVMILMTFPINILTSKLADKYKNSNH